MRIYSFPIQEVESRYNDLKKKLTNLSRGNTIGVTEPRGSDSTNEPRGSGYRWKGTEYLKDSTLKELYAQKNGSFSYDKVCHLPQVQHAVKTELRKLQQHGG